MNILKKIAGKILYAIAKLTSAILDVFIKIVETIVTVVGSIAKGLGILISMGGCLLIFFFAGPLGLAILMNPFVLLAIIFFVIFPILGTKFVSYMKYVRYSITEFLFDRANYLINGVSYQFKTFGGYRNKYKKMEEDRKRKEQQKRQEEQQKRQEEQQKEWEERFSKWNEYQKSQSWSSGQGSYGWYGQNAGYGNQNTYVNPSTEFKSKYEKSCDLLGVRYDADKYEIKLAYRKKAKEYHPDLNKAPDATEKFQQINNAYEFLSDGNIERYKSIG